jgi:hypothetical protein
MAVGPRQRTWLSFSLALRGSCIVKYLAFCAQCQPQSPAGWAIGGNSALGQLRQLDGAQPQIMWSPGKLLQ